jgi:hypothetical protein
MVCGTVMQPYLTTCCCGPAPLKGYGQIIFTLGDTTIGSLLSEEGELRDAGLPVAS